MSGLCWGASPITAHALLGTFPGRWACRRTRWCHSPPTNVNPRKLEHGFKMICAGIPYTLPSGHKENDVPTFWLLL